MTEVSYQDVVVESENPHFLLTNGNNDFLSLGSPNGSTLNGLFIKADGAYWKTLANLLPLSGEALTGLRIYPGGAVRNFGNMSQEMSFFDSGIRAKCSGTFLMSVDCKRMYDEDAEGRMYETSLSRAKDSESEMTLGSVSFGVVSYRKQAPGASRAEYTLHVAVATTMDLDTARGWRETTYSYDRRRGTGSSPWIFEAFTLTGEGIVAVAAAKDKAEAQSRALSLLMSKNDSEEPDGSLPERTLASHALAALRTQRGIMAGLPWFFKEWSRDELISLGGSLTCGDSDHAIKVVDKWYSSLAEDGSLPAIYPSEGLESVDAPGWLGRRTMDILRMLKERGDLLGDDTLTIWRDGAELMLRKAKERMRDGLVWTGYNTTWMDTAWNDDGREGACIEIQALTLALHEAYLQLCAKSGRNAAPELLNLGSEIASAVSSRMVEGDLLVDRLHTDGTPDYMMRPNLFLAWYASPQMFGQEQWKRFFHRALPELWLEWGGLSSISKSSGNYHERYTGEDVQSYHRGDSWYFVNNMAAIAMHSVDPDGFRAPVAKILRASVKDLFTQGFVGHCSEVSSAAEQEPCGCWAQAWSASTLVELIDEVFS